MEYFMMQQMLSAGRSWISVALLFGIFVVLAFRQQAIVSPMLFRFGVILYALSYGVPAIVESSLFIVFEGRFQTRQDNWSLLLTNGVSSALMAISIPLILFSMMPKEEKKTPVPSPPKPHPLD